jgi:hypothetical protein
MMNKIYKLKPEEIKNIAVGYGSCFATDMITVKGKKVGYMYRDEPDNEIDSGWRFMWGKESQKYMDNAENLAVYDINTIANYSPDIVEFLDFQYGSAFERNAEGELVEIED